MKPTKHMKLKQKEPTCCASPGCCDAQPAKGGDQDHDKRLDAAADDFSPAKATRQIKIDFLFLDLEVCTRCQGADSTLDDAIREVSGVLQAAGVEVLFNKVNVTTEALANHYRFESSPTIRIDGRDIALDVKESLCESCGDLCGDSVDCRVWSWQGREYTTPPKAMIVDAILRAIYGASPGVGGQAEAEQPFQLPENLKKFYDAMRRKEN